MDPAATGRRVSYLPCCCYLSLLLPLLLLQLLLVATAAVGRPATPGPLAVLHRENICSVAHSLDCRSFAPAAVGPTDVLQRDNICSVARSLVAATAAATVAAALL